MTILITGVAGLLGSRLSDWIIENYPEVQIIGIDNLSSGWKDNINDNIIFYMLDLSQNSIEKCFIRHNIDYVYHFAAYAAEGLSPFIRKFNYANNLISTANIINNCIKYNVKRLIFTSSMAVYGKNKLPFDETYIPSPIDPYGIAKYACEMDIMTAGNQHGLDWCIIRPHNVYGIKQNIWDKYRNVLGIWMYQHLNGMPITIFGDGEQKRSFSYIDDCLEPLWIASQSDSCSKEIINLGGTKFYTINEANRILCNIIENNNVIYKENRFEVYEAYSTWQKSVELLGYLDKTSLETGLKNMWEWAKKQPNRKRYEWKSFEIDNNLYEYWKPSNLIINTKQTKPKIKILVHNPQNKYTKHNRFYNDFWDEFTEYLKKYFIVFENRESENAHISYSKINLVHGTYNNNDYGLLECEYLIENLHNGEFVIMSVADLITRGVINEQMNPKLKKVLISQYLQSEIDYHIIPEFRYKYNPWTYFIFNNNIDLEKYYKKRLVTQPTENKLYFRGELTNRNILSYIDKNLITNFNIISRDDYFDEIIKYKISISIDGRGEFCYRDIECFGVGIPILRFEYVSKMHDPLIPNYHYISIPRPDDMVSYSQGIEEHAKLIVKRYQEVLNDDEFLKFIAQNARSYYEKNCTMNQIIKNTYELLELNNWL